ncbi:MAG TPA: hypothetical protein VIY48_00615 [Candidatus Paceibacterota bacterium]
MKAYKIDPKSRTITELEYDGTPLGFIQHFPYNTMEIREINEEQDCVLLCEAGLDEEKAREAGAWGIYCATCQKMHAYVGVALIFNRDGEDPQVMREVRHGIEEFREIVKWGDILEVRKEEGQGYSSLMNMIASLRDILRGIEKTPEEGEDHTLH